MPSCTTSASQGSTACPGKCGSSACIDTETLWVLATCEGAGMVFEKDGEKGTDKTVLKPLGGQSFSHPLSVHNLFDRLGESCRQRHFNQLIVVGSPVDIAWTHASLPADVARMVVAEVRYPLLASWFTDEKGIQQLQQAINTIVSG